MGLLAVAVVLATLLLTLVMPRHCPVNSAAWCKIKNGMTQAEAEKMLGGPPGDYRTRPGQANIDSGDDISWAAWFGDEAVIWVWFDHGVACAKILSPVEAKPCAPIDLIRW